MLPYPLILISILPDAMFASASLDGTIMIWTTYHLFPTRQFNFHDVYVDANRNTFKFNVNHLFALEQVRVVHLFEDLVH